MIDRYISFTTPQAITENLGLPYIFGSAGNVSLYLDQMPQQESYRLLFAQDMTERGTLLLTYQGLAQQIESCMNA